MIADEEVNSGEISNFTVPGVVMGLHQMVRGNRIL